MRWYACADRAPADPCGDEAPVGAEVYESLDVDGDFAAQIALHHIVPVDDLADLEHFGIGELIDPLAFSNVDFLAYFLGVLRSDAVNVAQGNHNALVGWYVDACYSGHASVSLSFPRDWFRRVSLAPWVRNDIGRAPGGRSPSVKRALKTTEWLAF